MSFKGTASRIGGVGFSQLAADAIALHDAAYKGKAFADDTAEAHAVPHAGDYHFRANPESEKHLNDPAAIAALQAAAQVCFLLDGDLPSTSALFPKLVDLLSTDARTATNRWIAVNGRSNS